MRPIGDPGALILWPIPWVDIPPIIKGLALVWASRCGARCRRPSPAAGRQTSYHIDFLELPVMALLGPGALTTAWPLTSA